MNDEKSNAPIIRELNDRFRQNIPNDVGVPGRVMLTSGIQAQTGTEVEPSKHLPALIERIRLYDGFSEDNDPYGGMILAQWNSTAQECFGK